MNTNNIFCIRRLYLLIRRQLLSNASAYIIGFAAISGSLLVITLLRGFFQPGDVVGLTGLYFIAMFIGGYIFTSNFFGELHQPQRSYQYLTLPVSTTERLLSAWIITAVVFPLVSILMMAVIVLAANLIMTIALDVAPFRSVFTQGSWTSIKVYMVTQSVFLFGAAYFRKNNFLKTVLALFVLSVIVQITVAVTGWALFSSYGGEYGGEFGGLTIGPENMSRQLETLFTSYIPATARIIFWYIMIPFFMVVTWFSIKERQV